MDALNAEKGDAGRVRAPYPASYEPAQKSKLTDAIRRQADVNASPRGARSRVARDSRGTRTNRLTGRSLRSAPASTRLALSSATSSAASASSASSFGESAPADAAPPPLAPARARPCAPAPRPGCRFAACEPGADVLKIEAPGAGDPTRTMMQSSSDRVAGRPGAFYWLVNRGKRETRARLKSERDAMCCARSRPRRTC